MFLFQRVHFKDHFLKGAPIGSMITDNLQLFSHNSVNHTIATKHNTLWLLCDNPGSHIRLDYASENGVFMFFYSILFT